MVAGSPAGNRHDFGEGAPFSLSWRTARGWLWSAGLLWQRTGTACTAIALYALAAAALLLPWPFGTHPAWAFNWEGYTAWRWATYWEPPVGPALDIWAPTDGLMTDSGQGPLVGLPVAFGVTVAGLDVGAMRIPMALLAAAAVPLLWLLGRRVVAPAAAALAAVLLAISPAFLLYGRTATLVGVSLVPLLLTALALARVLDAPPDEGWKWTREGGLVAALLLGIYAYAPVRLLWPLAVALLLLAAQRDCARRGVLLLTTCLCLLAVPAAVMVLERLTAPDPDPVAAAVGYFHARGEQLVALYDDPGETGQYVRDLNLEVEETSAATTVQRLVAQNAADLAWLLLDRETGPAPVDYWNEHGRFWPWFFLPLALIGVLTGIQGWRRLRQTATLLPLALTLGLMAPMLLTSRVHIGRLLPALPFALLLVAAGAWFAAGWVAALLRRTGLAGGIVGWSVAPILAGMLLVVPAAALARVEMRAEISPSREALTATAMAGWDEGVRERGGAVLVEDPALGDDIERVHAATYRLDLDRLYRFVDLHLRTGTPVPDADPRPPLFWRGALSALQNGAIAQPCQRLWFVAPEIADDFFTAWQATGCAGAPDSVILP